MVLTVAIGCHFQCLSACLCRLFQLTILTQREGQVVVIFGDVLGLSSKLPVSPTVLDVDRPESTHIVNRVSFVLYRSTQ